MVRQSNQQLMVGDLFWVRVSSHSWWPSQVVDEKCVSNVVKPKKRSANDVLVRLYGNYRYMFVDPAKYRSEFNRILKQNNGNCREIFLKYLEQDIARMKPGGPKKRASESREESMEERIEEELPRDDVTLKKQKSDSPEPVSTLTCYIFLIETFFSHDFH
ncbi:DNA (Cytosine-5)-methyltransferase [Thalictrum thalictroides]|uniref:DNA (Cytosine-5)-methyltransferase n=1 Tax=Thalictrum thalictroides TaxID=46969 RepID=A0A7J6VU13_THATH|nr:DNA (Cytosine-5)-methyltransferase [Thalictrum thalictroides]